MYNLNLVLPEIFVSLSIMFLLILGVFKKNSSQLTFNLSLLTFLIATIFMKLFQWKELLCSMEVLLLIIWLHL